MSTQAEILAAIEVNETEDGWNLYLGRLFYGPFPLCLEWFVRKSSSILRDYYNEAETLQEAKDHVLMLAFENGVDTFADHGITPPMDLWITVDAPPCQLRSYEEDPTLADWK